MHCEAKIDGVTLRYHHVLQHLAMRQTEKDVGRYRENATIARFEVDGDEQYRQYQCPPFSVICIPSEQLPLA